MAMLLRVLRSGKQDTIKMVLGALKTGVDVAGMK